MMRKIKMTRQSFQMMTIKTRMMTKTIKIKMTKMIKMKMTKMTKTKKTKMTKTKKTKMTKTTRMTPLTLDLKDLLVDIIKHGVHHALGELTQHVT